MVNIRRVLDYLLIDEAARIARCAPNTIRRWGRERGLPLYRPGKRLLVRRDELERFIEQERRAAGGSAGREEGATP